MESKFTQQWASLRHSCCLWVQLLKQDKRCPSNSACVYTLKDNQSHDNCLELWAPLKSLKFHQSSSCAWGSAPLPHCTGKFYLLHANQSLSCQKIICVLVKVSQARVTKQSREHYTIAVEGNLSLEENRRDWHSSPLSLMHPFSWPM